MLRWLHPAKTLLCLQTSSSPNSIKRDVAATCKWADPAINPPQQVFALDSVVESIRDNFEERLIQVEKALHLVPSTSSARVAERALVAAYASGSGSGSRSRGPSEAPHAKTQPSSPQQLPSRSPTPVDDHNHHFEAESAAIALEVLATGETMLGEVRPNEVKLSPDDFAARSIVCRDGAGFHRHNPKFPMLGRASQRSVVETFLGCIRSRWVCNHFCRATVVL